MKRTILLAVISSTLLLGGQSQSALANGAAPADVKTVQVTLDTKGVATTMHKKILKEIPSHPLDEIILLNGEPERLCITFDRDKLTGDNFYGERHLLIFPLQAYKAMFAQEKERINNFQDQIGKLREIIANKSARGVQDIPVFPPCDAAQLFHDQERFLNFKNGAGIAFISCYSNGDVQLTNKSQFYCFQGLTADRRYYVSFFAPIVCSGIPENVDRDKAIAWLSKLPRSKFSPSLESFDKMIQTLEVK
jgi:hypothetical protein